MVLLMPFRASPTTPRRRCAVAVLVMSLASPAATASGPSLHPPLPASYRDNICGTNVSIGAAVIGAVNLSWPGLGVVKAAADANQLGAACAALAAYGNFDLALSAHNTIIPLVLASALSESIILDLAPEPFVSVLIVEHQLVHFHPVALRDVSDIHAPSPLDRKHRTASLI